MTVLALVGCLLPEVFLTAGEPDCTLGLTSLDLEGGGSGCSNAHVFKDCKVNTLSHVHMRRKKGGHLGHPSAPV